MSANMNLNGALRFKPGTEVLCRTGEDEWSKGKIICHDYREPSWPDGETVPYQVRLDDGNLIFVPADSPYLCRKAVPVEWIEAVTLEDVASLQVAVAKKGSEEVDDMGRSPLWFCVEKGWQEGALFLLAQKADPCICAGPEKNTPLHLAVLPLSTVKFLDTDGDSVIFKREDGVISAKMLTEDSETKLYDECLTFIKYEEETGSLTWIGDPEEGDAWSSVPAEWRAWVPARLAALTEGTEVLVEGLPKPENTKPLVTALLQARADVNAQNEDPDNDIENYTSTTYHNMEQRSHRTALHYSAEAGALGLCAQLLAARANLESKDRYLMTPLDAAMAGGSTHTVDLLLRRGANPNQGNMQRGLQQTCLHYVSDLGNIDFVNLILKHRGKVNGVGKQGMTPLHLAARKKHIEIIEMLLESGADVTLTDNVGKTASQYALSNGSPALAKALNQDMELNERLDVLHSYKQQIEERQRLVNP